MANINIDGLGAAGALTGTELVEVMQGGVNKKSTVSAISSAIPATAYASNADAVAALGLGVIYKTTTVLADGVQPVLSVTV